MTTTTPEPVTLPQTGVSDAPSQPDEEAPPPYGSKRYWEERYSKNSSNKRHKADEDTGDENTEDPLPGHSWYFTYEELQPLIMPLILGKDENSDDDSENDDSENEESTGKQTTSGVNSSTKHSKSDKESKKGSIDSLESDGKPNFAKPGLKRILEIGCGDMPLGANLADEMNRLQGETAAKATSVIDKIVCCDYSEIVIQALKDEQSKKKQHEANKKIDGAIKAMYEVEDARKLSYANESFDLVIDKGTLDAMLSDKENGIKNCVEIVTECARVLATNGEELLSI
jgi:SAM-dependent methyltransferase